MRLSWLSLRQSLRQQLHGSYRRWLAREREEYGGLFLDEYGEPRFTCERLVSILFECLCGFLLSITTYVSIEAMYFSYSALEYLLKPLTGDMVFVLNSSGESLFWYITMCFFPSALQISTWKTVLMPLYLAPVYVICALLIPMLHLFIGYSSCIRILTNMRTGDFTHAQLSKQIALAFVAECVAWFCIHKFLLPDDRDLFMSEGDAVTSTSAAIVALSIGPASSIVRFYMEPIPTENTASVVHQGLQSDGIATKHRSIFGLLGLLVGGAYARTARFYLETVVIFGVAPALWRRIALRGLESTWIPGIPCFLLPIIFVYYLTRVSLCVIRRGYVSATLFSNQRSGSEINEGVLPV